MKIISSYKDYYDYLVGIYGEDPILVLDRRIHRQLYHHSNPTQPNFLHLYIGDYTIDFIKYGEFYYFGEDILNIPGINYKKGTELHRYWSSSYEKQYNMSWEDLLKHDLVELTWGNSRRNVTTLLLRPVKGHRPLDIDKSIVITLKSFGAYYNYQILSNLNLSRFISPETVYEWIIEYLSKMKLEQEQHPDTRTNLQKIEGKGFDKKTSFRPNIKK